MSNNYLMLISLLVLLTIFIYVSRKNNKMIPPLISIVIIVFPFLLILFLKVTYEIVPGEEIGDVGDWIGFLGGYIGAIIAIFGIWYQLQEEKRREIKAEEDRKKDNIISLFHLFIDACDNYSEFMEYFIKNEEIKKEVCLFPTKNIMEQLILESDHNFKDILVRGYARFFAIDLYNSLGIKESILIEKLKSDKEVFILISRTLKKILKEINKKEYTEYKKFKKYVLLELDILDDKSYEIDGVKKSSY